MLFAQGVKNSMPPLSRRGALSYNDRMDKNDWFPKNPWFSADTPEGGRFRFKWKLPLAFAALALLLFAFFPTMARVYTDFLWYQAEGFLSVWLRDILYSWATFAFVFTVSFLFLISQWGSARRHIGRSSPGMIAEHFAGPQIRTVVLLAALFFSFSMGGAFREQWKVLLSALVGAPFGEADPIFGMDAGFFVFTLPAISTVTGWFLALVMLSLIGCSAIYVLGSLPDFRSAPVWKSPIDRKAVSHLLRLCALAVFLWGVERWLARYDILFSGNGVVYGAGFVDSVVTLPAQTLLAILSWAAAVVLVLPMRKGKKVLLALAGTVLAVHVIAMGVLPSLVQRFIVEPNEFARERSYIERGIASTLKAYGLDAVKTETVVPAPSITRDDLSREAETLRNIRIWDEGPLLRSYKQLQEIRTYYDFDQVDMDRYTVGGARRQVMLSARELDLKELQTRTWVNTRLEFTHGFGVVMNPVTEIASEGQPKLWIRDIPPQVSIPLSIDRPQIYYGEKTAPYVFVRTTVKEFDYPLGDSNSRTVYDGRGGVGIGSLLRRVAFAIRFRDSRILFTDVFTPESRVLFVRSVTERLHAVAPFLLFDRDPYLAVVDGRLLWITDAVTVSDGYPYSQPVTVQDPLTSDRRTVNTVRGSVTATVDAYDGTITLYAVTPDDPILQTWSRIYPGLFTPGDTISASLRGHLRYPKDLFSIQAEIYRTYHMREPNTFYNKEDVWERTTRNGQRQGMDSYYSTLRLRGGKNVEFALITPFMPVGKDNLIAWMAGRCDAPNRGQLVVYTLPKQLLVYGPAQVEALTNQHPEISAQLSLWSQRGSDVIRGNITVTPVGESLLYTQSLYLKAENSDLPELKRVIVSSGGRVEWGESLDEALMRFLADAGAPAQGGSGAGGDAAHGRLSTSDPGLSDPARRKAATLAREGVGIMARSRAALASGDWAAYGEGIRKVEDLLAQISELTETSADLPSK